MSLGGIRRGPGRLDRGEIATLKDRRIGCRGKRRAHLAHLLDDELHHHARARRQMSPGRVDEAEWHPWRGITAQEANQLASAEIIDHLNQRKEGGAIAGTRGQMHRAAIAGGKSRWIP